MAVVTTRSQSRPAQKIRRNTCLTGNFEAFDEFSELCFSPTGFSTSAIEPTRQSTLLLILLKYLQVQHPHCLKSARLPVVHLYFIRVYDTIVFMKITLHDGLTFDLKFLDQRRDLVV